MIHDLSYIILTLSLVAMIVIASLFFICYFLSSRLDNDGQWKKRNRK